MVRRNSSSKDVTIGIWGTAEGDAAAIQQRLAAELEMVPETAAIRFIIPVHEDLTTDEVMSVAEWSGDNTLPYEAVTDAATSKTSNHALKGLLGGASKTHVVSNIGLQIVKQLEKAPGPSLFVLYDHDHPDDYAEVIQAALDAGVPAYDVLDDMLKLEPEPTAESTEEAEGDDESQAEGAEEFFSREALEAMERDELREIAVDLGISPPRSKSVLIDAILEAQGADEGEEPAEDEQEEEAPAAEAEADEEPAEPEAEAEEEEGDVLAQVKVMLDDFGARLLDTLAARTAPSTNGKAKAPAPKRGRRSSSAVAADESDTGTRRGPGRPRKDGTPPRPRVTDPVSGRKVRT